MISMDKSNEYLQEFNYHSILNNFNDFSVQKGSRMHILFKLEFAHFFLFYSLQVQENILLGWEGYFNDTSFSIYFFNNCGHGFKRLKLIIPFISYVRFG